MAEQDSQYDFPDDGPDDDQSLISVRDTTRIPDEPPCVV